MKRKGSLSNCLAMVVIVVVLVEGWLSGGTSAVTFAAAPAYAVAPADGDGSQSRPVAESAVRVDRIARLTPSVPAQVPDCTASHIAPTSRGFGSWATYQELRPLLSGTPSGSGFEFLTAWSQPYLDRLHVWLDAGIRFEGRWTSEELCLILDVLDMVGANLGAARFLDLVRAAVAMMSGGTRRYLTFHRFEERTKPAAGWVADFGLIVIKSPLFDLQYMHDHYRWTFMPDEGYTRRQREILIQKMTVAHELGHVLLDGMRAEYAAAGYGDLILESAYTGTVPTLHWPHPKYHPNENLATEVALWAMGTDRPSDVLAFRARYLAPTMTSPTWPQALSTGLAPALGLASR